MKLKKVVEDSHEEGGMARGQLERAIDYATFTYAITNAYYTLIGQLS